MIVLLSPVPDHGQNLSLLVNPIKSSNRRGMATALIQEQYLFLVNYSQASHQKIDLVSLIEHSIRPGGMIRFNVTHGFHHAR